MNQITTKQRKTALLVIGLFFLAVLGLCARLAYLMLFHSERYARMAQELHERERSIKAERGIIYDRNGVVLADNKPVCTVSVIHSQITDPERVISVLCEVLELSEETVRKRVEKQYRDSRYVRRKAAHINQPQWCKIWCWIANLCCQVRYQVQIVL